MMRQSPLPGATNTGGPPEPSFSSARVSQSWMRSLTSDLKYSSTSAGLERRCSYSSGVCSSQ